MKALIAFAALALSIAPPAAAQSSIYICTPDNSATSSRYRIGPGLIQYSSGGSWGSNWCTDSDTSCRYEGSRFLGDGPEFEFTFDFNTGRFSEDDPGGYDVGSCRPE